MHIVVFGLTISSSWGNGHATLWRSLVKALLRRGHTLTFFERDTPYYAETRDVFELPQGATLRLYSRMADVANDIQVELDRADLALCTSYCPDGVEAARRILDSRTALRAFYDLDTPVTLQSLGSAATRAYLPAEGLGAFDLVLSYTGGRALDELQGVLGARKVAALYGWVDPEMHHPVPPVDRFRSAFSYLGTYAADRQAALDELFLRPATELPRQRFLIGGAQYPQDFPWADNVFFTQHLEPAQHPAFFCSSRATLNITRRAMADYGFCPSGRLFEAAACGIPLLSDRWEGIDRFFTPGTEVLLVESAADVLGALGRSDEELARVARAARERTLAEHTADHRAAQLEALCTATLAGEQTRLAAVEA